MQVAGGLIREPLTDTSNSPLLQAAVVRATPKGRTTRARGPPSQRIANVVRPVFMCLHISPYVHVTAISHTPVLQQVSKCDMPMQVKFWDVTDEHVRMGFAALGKLASSDGPDADDLDHRVQVLKVRVGHGLSTTRSCQHSCTLVVRASFRTCVAACSQTQDCLVPDCSN